MKSFISQTKNIVFSTLRAYGMSVLIFIFGCIPFFALGPKLLSFFSFLALIMQICIVYSFVNKEAIRDVRDNEIGPLGNIKGFVTGTISMIPFAVVMVVAEFALPKSTDWMVAIDFAGLVQTLMAYGGYFYYGASSGLLLRLTALIIPVVVSGLGYLAAIKKFDVGNWVDVKILKKEGPKAEESGYEYVKRTRRKF